VISRNTRQREETFEAVKRLKNHPTARDVYEEVIKRSPHVSKSTVYRNLSDLSEEGRIRKIPVLGTEPDRYDHNVMPHYHAICKKCGSVFDIENGDVDVSGSFKHLMDMGFEKEEIDMLVIGTCKNCKENQEWN